MKNGMIRPPRLRAGDVVGLAAPSGCFEHNAVDRGVSVLEGMGFGVKIPESVFARKGYLAGSDEQRAGVLTDLFADSDVRAVFCVRGGFGAERILPLLDFEKIRRNPKILVGFSDITVLLCALYRKLNLITFHGPLVTTLDAGSEITRRSLFSAITAEEPVIVRPQNPLVLRPGYASGPVIGGNLTNICNLVGTPYEPGLAGAILLLEDTGEALYRIDRMLCHLRLSGRLAGLSGVIVGSFSDCGRIDVVHQLIREYFADRDIPVLAGFDIGHGGDNMTIPIGLEAELDADKGLLAFKGCATRLP